MGFKEVMYNFLGMGPLAIRKDSGMVTRSHSETEKMRRVPGIVFADEGSGRVPRIAGTGLEVFEVIQVYLSLDRKTESLKRAFPWLSQEQLDAALKYYAEYPEEVDAVIAENDACMSQN
jgi:uncharacterized protein (DUF433 family)